MACGHDTGFFQLTTRFLRVCAGVSLHWLHWERSCCLTLYTSPLFAFCRRASSTQDTRELPAQIHKMALRVKSLPVAEKKIESLCTKLAKKLQETKPDALLWLTDSHSPAAIAKVASRACGASIGARTDAGLIGGGSEYYGPPGDEARVTALAIQNAGAVTPFYSPPEGLPELDDWATLASSPPEQAPPLFSSRPRRQMLASI